MIPASGGAHLAHSEKMLSRTAALFRLGGLVQIASAFATVTVPYRTIWPAVLLALVVSAESALMIAIWWRRSRIDARWLTADVMVCAAALLAGGWLSPMQASHTWAFFMYPFTLIACVAVGAGYRGLHQVLAAAALLVAAYLVATALLHNDPWWNLPPNALSYVANTVITWLIARELRRSGAAADASEQEALARTADLAREREATRYSRALHDRVLQTLEMLSQGHWISDKELRAHVGAEAVWLRGLVSGTPPDQPDDLLAGLQAVAADQARRGLRVELNGTNLSSAQTRQIPPKDVVEGVCGAVREALTNVCKHAGVTTAVVRARLSPAADELTVSVLDQGVGFDPAAGAVGTGLAASIRQRIRALGGTVIVDSAPGAGTHVEMRVPLPPAGAETSSAAAGISGQ
ncbi:ATP-binding protein [Nonomuraea sp. NPDC049784]|uniref:sensor histidine kinase n=1 Tax=Nonomuraea sp. NPDC049784 TaxID=3154361 RepID=UPI0033CC4EF9